MTSFLFFLTVLGLTPLWIMAAHALAVRLGTRGGQGLALFVSAAASVPVGAALWAVYLGSLEGPGLWGAALYAALSYLLLAYSYFHLFNMGETARRVHILVELGDRGAVEVEELASVYNAREMLSRRVERLVSLGQARLEDGRMVLASRRLYLAAMAVDSWARVLGLPSLRRNRPRR